jgi:hypothetical protein
MENSDNGFSRLLHEGNFLVDGMVTFDHIDFDPWHVGSGWLSISTTYMPAGEDSSTVSSTRSTSPSRCGHYEEVKIGRKWKCTECGQILTISESIQNSIQLSEVMRTAVETRISLRESLDISLGHREWEEMRAKIPTAKQLSKRKHPKSSSA